MIDLNSRDEIAKLDKQNVLGSVEALPDQCLHAWEDASRIVVPESYRNFENVVMCGMGGSGLGARVIESVYASKLAVPLTRVNDYHLPNFVNENTLVICSSYSGETEETLQNANEAIDKKAKWMAIANGGKLLEIARLNNVPYYDIYPKNNPSNQPRMAIGYSIIGQLVLASHSGLFTLEKANIDQSVSVMREVMQSVKVEVSESTNNAKKLATLMKDKIILYFAAEHLVGAMHVVNNQLNENAKNLSADYQISELNHHLMEGLVHPATNPENVLVVLAKSQLYSPRLQQRLDLTKQVVEKIGLATYEITITSETKLSQAFELIQFGAYTNFYLAMHNGLDPAPIPWVDYFKERLGQPLGK